MLRELGLTVAVAALCACGGQGFTVIGDAGADGSSSSSGGGSGGSSSGGSSGGSSSSSGGSSSGSGGSSSSSGGSSGSSSGGMGRVPVNHRVDDSQCSQPPGNGTCSFGGSSGGGMCSSDAQCADAGPNGRCIQFNGGVAFCGCTYDACEHDTDCTGGPCACHGSPYTGGAGNTCVMGNCRVDSDCGAGGYCSPTYSTNGCGSLGGYYCHTAADQCIDDSDCAGSGLEVCAYSSGNWQCQQQVLCQ